ncbi:MAG TPA: class I SAM-dependent methyltransferase [Chthoniobacterales bacterium]|nr:class I SAM-dependent methyltransferase [Chthoniobacterales bacterium]
MKSEPNIYSPRWFEFFHVGIDQARTVREVEFVCRCAPRPEFQKILDAYCGMGRHARALCDRGYAVTGIDRDPEAIAKATELGGGANYMVADIREFQAVPGAFDAAIVMGQSFGHFDESTNRDILSRVAAAIRDRGRIILDLWNPDFFAAHQGDRELTSPRGTVHENKRVSGNRLCVQLDYPDGAQETFAWQLFTPEQMEPFAKSAGLVLQVACSGFDPQNLPSPDDPRLQFVLEASSRP